MAMAESIHGRRGAAPGAALALLALACGAVPGAAQEANRQGQGDIYETSPDREYNPETTVFGPLPRWRSEDGNFNFGAGAIMQFDIGAFDHDPQGSPGTRAPSPDFDTGLLARRGIFLINGILYKDYIFFVSHDFFDPGDRELEGQRSAVLAWRGLDPLWFVVGQQNLPAALDAATFSTRRPFLEESMSSGAFGYAPGTPSVGASLLHRSKHHYLRFGVWGVPVDEYGHDSEGWGVHGRATYAPIAERDRVLHFGISGYWRRPTVKRGDFGGSERFAARPDIDVDGTSLVDTGDIPRVDSFAFGAVEVLGNWGPLSVEGEYHRMMVDRFNGPHEAPFRDLTFDGYHVQASYYLTGESQNFLSNFATLWRVKPNREFDPEAGGWGAFEVAARFAHIDLDDGVNDLAGGGIRGGEGETYTLALNWYPNALIKLSLNLIHADIDKQSDEGLNEGQVVNALGVRLQWEF
jgi:phosphate-selective porin OprO/OprP